MSPDAPECSKMSVECNTSISPPPKVFASKKWCFTLNNWTTEQYDELLLKLVEHKYIIGKEVGEQGTPHLQGYIEFKNKKLPMGYMGIKEIHWEKAKKCKEANLLYCSKSGDFVTNFKMPSKKAEYKKEIITFYPWQSELLNLLREDPHERKIHWFWEPSGCAGKTTIQKYVYTHFDNCVVLSGKACDMKNGIVQCKELPRIVLINIPRSSLNYISYAGIEEIKDMFFFSPKYEGGMVCGPEPHVIVFANEPPEDGKMSADRWVVHDI